MLRKLKKFLFKEKEKKEAETIELKVSGLKDFISEKIKEINRELKDRVDAYKKQIEQGKKKTLAAVEKLEKATLHNPDVPIRSKQFMEGNRSAYIKKVNELMQHLHVPDKIEDITTYCDDFELKMQEFLRSTQKSYQVLQEFFSHESGEIAHTLRGYEKLLKDIKRTIAQADLEKYFGLTKKEEEMCNLINKDKELAKEILEKNHILQNKKKERVETNLERDNILTSDEYQKIKDAKKRIIAINENLKRYEFDIINNFSTLKKGLKKYAKISIDNENTINKYVHNAYTALLNDNSLKIVPILEYLQKNIDSGSVELNEKKKVKSLIKIRELNKQYLSETREKIMKETQESNKLLQELKNSQVNKQFIELTDKIEYLDEEIKRLESRIEVIQDQKNSEQINQLKGSIVDEIRDLFGFDLKLV